MMLAGLVVFGPSGLSLLTSSQASLSLPYLMAFAAHATTTLPKKCVFLVERMTMFTVSLFSIFCQWTRPAQIVLLDSHYFKMHWIDTGCRIASSSSNVVNSHSFRDWPYKKFISKAVRQNILPLVPKGSIAQTILLTSYPKPATTCLFYPRPKSLLRWLLAPSYWASRGSETLPSAVVIFTPSSSVKLTRTLFNAALFWSRLFHAVGTSMPQSPWQFAAARRALLIQYTTIISFMLKLHPKNGGRDNG